MTTPLLSICIPTYNMGEFLEVAIQSILSQITPTESQQIEVCISDNLSEDNTEMMVQNYQQKAEFPISYKRNTENIGAERNFLQVVEMARGEYCWLFGADDAFPAGAISLMLKEISDGFDLYLCNRIECDYFLNPIQERYWLNSKVKSQVFDTKNPKELSYYLSEARSLGALFSFMSSNVFRRKAWNEIIIEEKIFGTAYIHVYKLMMLVDKGCALKYLSERLVFCRGDNDSFLENKLQRLLLDFKGYQFILDQVFEKNFEKRNKFCIVMQQEHPWYRLIRLRSLVEKNEDWGEIKTLLFYFGYSKTLVFICALIGRNKSLIALLLKIRNKVWRKRADLLSNTSQKNKK